MSSAYLKYLCILQTDIVKHDSLNEIIDFTLESRQKGRIINSYKVNILFKYIAFDKLEYIEMTRRSIHMRILIFGRSATHCYMLII